MAEYLADFICMKEQLQQLTSRKVSERDFSSEMCFRANKKDFTLSLEENFP